MKKFLFYCFLGLFFSQCIPITDQKITDVRVDLTDPILQKIHSFKDQRNSDSLVLFFDDPDPSYRYAAAMAMASVQDEDVIEDLAILLNDEVDLVAIAAAYALGQTASVKAENFLINAFQKNDSTLASKKFNKTVLEAVGKAASPTYLDALSTISTYTRKDTVLLEGQAYGIYRYALRNITNEKGTKRMLDIVSDGAYPESVRFIAANYLSRSRNIQLDSFAAPLILAIGKAETPRTAMALAIALGKSKTPEALQTLKTRYQITEDYRVKCNMLRALSNFNYEDIREVIIAALNDLNINVALSAGEILLNKGAPREAVDYWKMAKDTIYPWQVRSILYRASNRHLPPYFEVTKGRINNELRQIAENAETSYEKAGALMALAEYGWNYRYISSLGLASSDPVLRTASADAIAYIANYPGFRKWFGGSYRRVKLDLADYFTNAIKSGDVGMIYVASNVLTDTTLDYKSVIDSTGVMDEALKALNLPKDIESYNALNKAINHLNGLPTPKDKTPEYNNPVNWNQLSSISDGTRAVIVTRKGNITLRFFTNDTPASVINFVQLAKTGYFDGKRFHRVVPNFVVQDGCPRGDGYGGADFSIRSELPLRYYNQEGYVGMASAGKDTEGTQWFITHSPTPHLDGRYTIFAEVIEGMNVVHQLAVGDVIERIVISK
jgi:cyclophilin family peptidyl-prolyl cis-trans isomerase/HEAT repeat protein